MRILHVANFNTHKYGADLYSTDRKISAGLIQNGHLVYDFSYRDVCRNESLLRTTKFSTKTVNKKLIKACDNLHPHLLLLGHSELIHSDTLKFIKHKYPDIKIGLWYVDALFHRKKTEHLFARLESIDVVFATSSGKYLKEYATSDTLAAFFPNIVDQGTEPFRAFENQSFDHDFIFCGRDTNDPQRRQFMVELKEAAEKHMRCAFKGCLGSRPITGYDYLQFLSQAKMGLNISRENDIDLYSSDRIAQLMGNGLLTFCPEIPKMRLLFSDNEIVYFRDLNELVSKLLYFHERPTESQRIAENGWKKIHSSCNARRVTNYMLERLFDLPLSSDYEWEAELFQ